MVSPLGPVYYGDYLKLDTLTDCQHPKSKLVGNESHDETLFIIVHQVYELWFKQILHEMKSVQKMFLKPKVEDRDISTAIARFERVIKIQSLLLDQLVVMETMTPMDFLEFRNLLVPASGFQSVQFREIEIISGLSTSNRQEVDNEFFLGRLSDKDRARIGEIESTPSLLLLVQSWLERIPFTKFKEFDFWTEYNQAVDNMLDKDEEIINANLATLSETAIKMQLENLASTRATFKSLFDEEVHNQMIKDGKRTLSQKATLNALFILLYRDEPILQLPYRLLTSLMDIDENFTTWRYRHSMMAHRMLGSKIGTGGSSGHEYLKKAAENNRVYLDLFNLSTFLIPRSKLPILPAEISKNLSFYFQE